MSIINSINIKQKLITTRENKIRINMWLFISCLAFSFSICDHTSANYEDPTGLTNQNKVDPLFEEQIDNFSEFEGNVESQRNNAAVDINNEKIEEALPNIENAKAEADRLGNINANDLESLGIAEFNKNPDLNDIFIDYSKPGMSEHKEDAEKIANATDKLLSDVLGKLKEIGIDCKSIKGNKVIEPEHFIEIEKTPIEDTVYDQHFCEHLRNQYSCTDKLEVSCVRSEMKWESNWEDRQITLSGDQAYDNHRHWGWTVLWKEGNNWAIRKKHRKKRYGWLIGSSNLWVHKEVGEYIATLLNIHPGHIDLIINFPGDGRGYDPTHDKEGNEVVFDRYVLGYKYRKGELICTEWKENWTEECRLKP